MGDGVLAEFQSATEAVSCAVEIQRSCAERNRKFSNADPIKLRIGINVADVMFDHSDIAGGGVNLAARLETLAPPGGICIPQALREQIHDDLGVTYLDAGTRRVKNISKPVRVFRVLTEPPTPLERISLSVGRLPLNALVVAGVAVSAVVIGVTITLHKPEEIGPEKLSLQVGEFKSSVANDSEGLRIGKSLSQKIYLALSPERHLLHIKSSTTGDATPATGKPLARYVVEGVVTRVTGGYRVDARLVGSQDRTTLWGDGFWLMDQSTESIELGAHRIAHVLTERRSRSKSSAHRSHPHLDRIR